MTMSRRKRGNSGKYTPPVKRREKFTLRHAADLWTREEMAEMNHCAMRALVMAHPDRAREVYAVRLGLRADPDVLVPLPQIVWDGG